MKHKNFVSMAALLIFLISAMVLVTGCPTGVTPSGSNNAGGSSSEAPVPPSINEEEPELIALLGKISFDRTVITLASEIITISDLPSGAVVTSSNAELIEYQSPDKLNIKKLPETTTEVKITITLIKNGTSKSRDFTVKVFKDGETPITEDYLATLEIPTTVSDDFDLPKTLQNGTGITWSTENEKIIKIENSGTNQKAVVMPDIVEQKVTLTATANGKTKDFKVTVLPVTKIEIGSKENKTVCEFAQGKITVKYLFNDKLSHGRLYSYTVDISDPENKKITVTNTSIFSGQSNTWLTVEETYNFEANESLKFVKNLLKGIDSLLNKPDITISDLKEVFKNLVHNDISESTDEEFYNDTLPRFIDLGISYGDFINLTPQEQTDKLKAGLTDHKKKLAKRINLPENASTEQILAETEKEIRQFVDQEIKNDKKPRTYRYHIGKDTGGNLRFETNQVYDSSVPWYENNGVWSYNPTGSPTETSWISHVRVNKYPDGHINVSLSVRDANHNKQYDGTITENASNYTFTGSLDDNPGEQITATITDNKNGKLTVTVTEGGSASSTLNFEKSLW